MLLIPEGHSIYAQVALKNLKTVKTCYEKWLNNRVAVMGGTGLHQKS